MRPMDQGFDESLVHRGGGLAQPSEPIENARRYTDPILIHNGDEIATKGYCTDVYFDAALAFLERSHAADKPFFIYLPPNAPHGPFHGRADGTLRKIPHTGSVLRPAGQRQGCRHGGPRLCHGRKHRSKRRSHHEETENDGAHRQHHRHFHGG